MSDAKGMAQPVIKYAGGKRWAIPIIGARIRDRVLGGGGRLVDPFVGGGALPLHLGVPALLGDLYLPVAELYQVLREKPGELVWNLSAVAMRGVAKEDYYRVRKWRPKTKVGRAARFLYLNRLSFNGLIRENGDGEFNVPYAKDVWRESSIERCARDAVDSLWPNKEKFHQAARALEHAEILHADFSEPAVRAAAGDVLLIDSPYIHTYAGYTAKGFGLPDHERLARVVCDAAGRGVHVIAFNTDCREIRALYAGFHFFPSREKRQINSDGKGRGRVRCVIITSDPDLVDRAALRAENGKGKARTKAKAAKPRLEVVAGGRA